MRNPLRTPGLALVLWIALGSLARSGPPEPAKIVPDPKGGVIDGKAAVAVMPVRYGKGSNQPEVLDPSGLEARLTPQDESDVELVHPCGAWFQVAPGQYRFWIQGGWRMSPFSMVLVQTASTGPGMTSVVPIGDAGRVVLPAKAQINPNLVLQLLSLGSYREGNFLRWEISPRKAVGELGDGLLLPVGKAIGGLWDRKARRYVALSRPFEVRARETVEVPLDRPAGMADLVFEARRHAPVSTVADDDVVVSLQRDGGALPPDLKVSTADRIYAVWYGLAPGQAEVRIKSQTAALAPQPVNLSAGGIERLTVQLKPRAMVSGTVFRGDQAHSAKLTFTTVTQKTIKVRTDANGAYEVVLVDPLRMVVIELDGVKSGPYTELFSPVIAEAQERDLHVPKAEPRVKVVDTTTGKGIPNASVIARNIYYPPEATDEDAEAQKIVVSLKLVTDVTGVAWLPPLRQGSLELQVTAEGYMPMPQPVEERVEGTANQTFEVPLEPVGETVALHLRLPNGEPATRADVSLVDSLESGESMFTERADGEGVVHAPRKQAGFLLIKHPAAGFLVREWPPQSGDEEPEWVLPAPAGQALTIQVVDASGQNAVANAELALWVQNQRLAGATLAWLTGTSLADTYGAWTATNLPRGPVAVLAWGPRVRDEAWSGRLDAQASEAEPPWPNPVVVRAIE